MFNREFNNILRNKNKVFFDNITNIYEKAVLKFYFKKKKKAYKKPRFKVLFSLFMRLNNLFGKFPNLNFMNIKIKNKKKRVRTVNFVYLSLEIINNNFFELFFLKNNFFNLFYRYIKKYKFNYGQELKHILNHKSFLFNSNTLICKVSLNSFFLNLSKYKFKKKFTKSRKFFSFKLVLKGQNIKYFFNFINTLFINNNKILLFYYKSLRNKKIKV